MRYNDYRSSIYKTVCVSCGMTITVSCPGQVGMGRVNEWSDAGDGANMCGAALDQQLDIVREGCGCDPTSPLPPPLFVFFCFRAQYSACPPTPHPCPFFGFCLLFCFWMAKLGRFDPVSIIDRYY